MLVSSLTRNIAPQIFSPSKTTPDLVWPGCYDNTNTLVYSRVTKLHQHNVKDSPGLLLSGRGEHTRGGVTSDLSLSPVGGSVPLASFSLRLFLQISEQL